MVGDTTLVTASQNLAIGVINGDIPIGSRYRIRPTVDLKFQSREEVDGNAAGSGWIMGVGADVPLRVFGVYDFFPSVRYVRGGIEDTGGIRRSVTGAQVTLTVRRRF